MLDAAADLTGLPPGDAARRLIDLQGLPCHDQHLMEECEAGSSAEALVAALHTRGLHARLVRLRAGDLSYVSCPALLKLRDDSWVILHARTATGLVLETDRGLRQLSRGESQPALAGIAIEILPSIVESRSVVRAITSALLAHRRSLVQLAAAGLVVQALSLLPPLITWLVLDRALPDAAGSLLAVVALGVLLASLFRAWTGWVQGRIILYLETRLEVVLGRALLEHLLRLPFSVLQGRTVGSLLQGFYGLSVARELLTEQAVRGALDGVMAPLYLVLMVSIMPAAAAMLTLAAVAMLALTIVVGYVQRRARERELRVQARERSLLVELVSGIASVKVCGAEERVLEMWRALLRTELSLGLRVLRSGLWSEVGLPSLRQAALVLALIWGGAMVLSGRVSVGALMAFGQLASGFLVGVFGLATTYNRVAVARPQVAKAGEILQLAPRARLRRANPTRLRHPVILENVWFRYAADGPWIIKSHDLTVEPGEWCPIQGPSGSGKTTLLRLIAGLYVPDRGSILVGGEDPASAGSCLIYLPQFLQLHAGSILESLRILSGQASLKRILEVAEETGLHEWVGRLPMAYNTLLSQGARNLSGGQRQLVALTAAAASGAGLLLLDEPMSGLDAAAQLRVLRTRSLASKTVICATHQGGVWAGPPPPSASRV